MKGIGIDLVDFKLEFGKTADGTIVLADEISPDTCRLWDEQTHEKLDKDRFRRDMGGAEEAYKEVMRRLMGIGQSMGGFFGAITKQDCVLDVFFGTDYHSHLGTKRGGMAVYDRKDGFQRQIHNIENTPFRTRFNKDLAEFHGCSGIGCISDTDPQPLLVRSHLGLYAITTVGIINNADALVERYFSDHGHQFMAMSSGKVNATELVAALINQKDDLISGIRHAQDGIDGSATILILDADGILAARDKLGRLPVLIGQGENGCCVSFESFAYHKLGYHDAYELGPREIVRVTAGGWKTLSPAGDQMKICAFLWTYYGYPNSNYEGMNVEVMRYRNGEIMARDEVHRGQLPKVDYVAGVPDSGVPHAIGFANRSGKPFARPFVKYTPTWPRSFMPTSQEARNQVAKMKQIPVPELIEGKKLLFVDDSIVRGTQLRETVEFLYESGAEEVHMRSACPPVMYGCKYLNFSRSNSDMELLARRTIQELEGDEGQQHIEGIRRRLHGARQMHAPRHLREAGLRLSGLPVSGRPAGGHRHRPGQDLHLLLDGEGVKKPPGGGRCAPWIHPPAPPRRHSGFDPPSPVHSAGGCPPMAEQAAAYSGELNSPADLFCNSFTRKAGKTLRGFVPFPRPISSF